MSALAVGPADPLGGLPHSLADYVGNPGDELPVGGLAPVGADGVAEVAQRMSMSARVQVTSIRWRMPRSTREAVVSNLAAIWG